jgi:hypothetical protein
MAAYRDRCLDCGMTDGMNCPTCRGERRPDPARDERALRELLAAVQAWQVILLQIEDALIAELYDLTPDELSEAA